MLPTNVLKALAVFRSIQAIVLSKHLKVLSHNREHFKAALTDWNPVVKLFKRDEQQHHERHHVCDPWGSTVCGKIYKDTSPLKREKCVLRRSMSLRNSLNPQEAWQDIWALGWRRRITTQMSGRAVLQACHSVMKKNPSNDKSGYIKVMLSWQALNPTSSQLPILHHWHLLMAIWVSRVWDEGGGESGLIVSKPL